LAAPGLGLGRREFVRLQEELRVAHQPLNRQVDEGARPRRLRVAAA